MSADAAGGPPNTPGSSERSRYSRTVRAYSSLLSRLKRSKASPPEWINNMYFISSSPYEVATLRRPAETAWTGRCQARKRLALSVEPFLERGAGERGVRAGKQAAVLVELVVWVVRVAYSLDS
jgi:hypothetical protein